MCIPADSFPEPMQEGVAWSQFVLELPLLVSNLARIRAYFQYSLMSYHDIIF